VPHTPVRDGHFPTRVLAKNSLASTPKGNTRLVVACKISTEDGEPVYTMPDRKYGDRICRRFYDDLGLPLNELYIKSAFGVPYMWIITMPLVCSILFVAIQKLLK
jgi:hypothetical protein